MADTDIKGELVELRKEIAALREAIDVRTELASLRQEVQKLRRMADVAGKEPGNVTDGGAT